MASVTEQSLFDASSSSTALFLFIVDQNKCACKLKKIYFSTVLRPLMNCFVRTKIKVTDDSLHKEFFSRIQNHLYLDKGRGYEAETNTKM